MSNNNNPWPATEYALVAFPQHQPGRSNDGTLLWWTCGGYFDLTVPEVGASACDVGISMSSSSDETPDHGLWVWEGKFTFQQDQDGCGDYICRGSWREPTENEWSSIRSNENPFMKGNLGDVGVRDPEYPCVAFATTKETSILVERNECAGDGHYLCRECRLFAGDTLEPE